MSVKEYQALPEKEPKEEVVGEKFRTKVDYDRMTPGKIVPVYVIINVKEGSYEYMWRQIKLV